MLKSLFKTTKKAAGVAMRDPEGVAAAAVALDRFRKTGEFLVMDSLLESRIMPAVEAHPNIDAAVLFGFQDQLRLLLVLRIMGQPFEVMCSLTPTACSWGPSFSMSFDFAIIRWECLGTRGKVAAAGLRQAIAAMIPFGGIVNALGSRALDHTVKQMGVAQLHNWDGLTDRGVSVAERCATVDLRAQPELAPLWTDAAADRGGLIEFVAGATGVPSQAADLFTISGIRADREGLHLAATLSPVAAKLFEASAGAGSAVQSGIAGILSSGSEAVTDTD